MDAQSLVDQHLGSCILLAQAASSLGINYFTYCDIWDEDNPPSPRSLDMLVEQIQRVCGSYKVDTDYDTCHIYFSPP